MARVVSLISLFSTVITVQALVPTPIPPESQGLAEGANNFVRRFTLTEEAKEKLRNDLGWRDKGRCNLGICRLGEKCVAEWDEGKQTAFGSCCPEGDNECGIAKDCKQEGTNEQIRDGVLHCSGITPQCVERLIYIGYGHGNLTMKMCATNTVAQKLSVTNPSWPLYSDNTEKPPKGPNYYTSEKGPTVMAAVVGGVLLGVMVFYAILAFFRR